MSKKFRRDRFVSADGEMHFVYEQSCSCEWVVEKEACDECEARRVSKSEASKPLFLVRED